VLKASPSTSTTTGVGLPSLSTRSCNHPSCTSKASGPGYVVCRGLIHYALVPVDDWNEGVMNQAPTIDVSLSICSSTLSVPTIIRHPCHVAVHRARLARQGTWRLARVVGAVAGVGV